MNRETREIHKNEIMAQVAKEIESRVGQYIEFELVQRNLPSYNESKRGVWVWGILKDINNGLKYREELEEDILKLHKTTWDRLIQEMKDAGRLPISLNDACLLAWCEVERIQPFSGYDQISMRGIRHWIINWVLGFPKNLVNSWTDMPVDIEEIEDHLPELVEEYARELHERVNQSPHGNKVLSTLQPSPRASWRYFGV